jgi:hypothetical protein
MNPAILFALIFMNGNTLDIKTGYATLADCQRHTGFDYVGRGKCIAYNSHGKNWAAVMGWPQGSVRLITKFRGEADCRSFLTWVRPEVPSVCKEIDTPELCDPAIS